MATADETSIDVIIPTGVNLVLMINENIMANLRQGQAAQIELPSLYKRAFLVVNETDEVAVLRGKNG